MNGAHSFRANDVLTALEDVKRKLGPDALVVSVRQVPPGPFWKVWQPAQVEVVAMSPSPKQPRSEISEPAPKEKSGSPASRLPAGKLVKKGALSTAESLAVKGVTAQPVQPKICLNPGEKMCSEKPIAATPELSRLRLWLVTQGVDESLVDRIADICQEMLSPRSLSDELRLQDFFKRQLSSHLRKTQPVLPAASEKTICLIGAHGVGKTSMGAKLAAAQIKAGKKVAWVCANTISTGSVSEARVYTDTLGIPLYLAYMPEELASAVQAASDADFVLVDMPGCNPYKESSVVALGDLLSVLPNRTTYLVASAMSKDADLKKTMFTFRPFNLKG